MLKIKHRPPAVNETLIWVLQNLVHSNFVAVVAARVGDMEEGGC